MTGQETELRWLPREFKSHGPPSNASIYTFLFKVATLCNLNCDYCYVYRGPDQSWRSKPKFMSADTARAACERIAEHAWRHKLSSVAINFHGGEPLLAGRDRLEIYIKTALECIPCKVEFCAQTNATLLDQDILNLFAQYQVNFGVSIDGPKEYNDKHRLFRNGKSSFHRLMKALSLINKNKQWEEVFGGYLTVIDLANDPQETFRFLLSLGAKSFDILLPDCNHDALPPRPASDFERTAYGRWMASLFDVWINTPGNIEIRYFDEIIGLLLGGESSLEAIGAKIVDLIVIESNGDIEAVDTLKTVSRSATKLNLSVYNNSFDEALQHPAIFSRYLGYEALCKTCRDCSYLTYCGGGYLPHRYGGGEGFQNPSVYCTDIIYLINHISKRLQQHIPLMNPEAAAK